MTKAIVTGANGFIAKHLVNALHHQGTTVIPLCRQDGDISRSSTWEKLPAVDIVYHLAGETFVPASWEKSQQFYQTNVVGTENAINYCISNGSSLVYANGYTYGIPSSLPLPESSCIEPSNPYSLSKHLGEQLCLFASKYRGLTATSLRIFNVYGIGQSTNFLIPHIFDSLINKSIIRIKDLIPRRDYVYVSDVISAFLKAQRFKCGYRAINIGSGESYSVAQILDKIIKISGRELPIITENTQRSNEIQNVVADIRLARSLLDWLPLIGIDEGLQKIWKASNVSLTS